MSRSTAAKLQDRPVRVVLGAMALALVALGVLLWFSVPLNSPLAEVRGKVTLDGRPLPLVEVIFLPDPVGGSRAQASSGVTDETGEYRMHTARGAAGALVGVHRVLIQEARPDPATRTRESPKPSPRVPDVYSHAVSTPFSRVEVHRGDQFLDFNLTTPAASQASGLPLAFALLWTTGAQGDAATPWTLAVRAGGLLNSARGLGK